MDEQNTLSLEDALDEMHGWVRVLAGEQGAERGFRTAIEALRQASGQAFARGDDDEADALRAHADLLGKSPLLEGFRTKAEDAYRRYEEWRDKAAALESVEVPA